MKIRVVYLLLPVIFFGNCTVANTNEPSQSAGEGPPRGESPQSQIIFEAKPLEVAWTRSYGDRKAWFESSAVALAGNGELVIAATAHVPNEKGNGIRLWTINPAGEQTQDIELHQDHADIKGLVVLENGDTLLVVEFVEERPSLVRVDKSGKILFSKLVAGPTRDITTTKFFRLANQKLILAGREGGVPLVMQLDDRGGVLWEKKLDRSKVSAPLDGAPTEQGGFVLLGGPGPEDGSQASSSWLGVFDDGGQIKNEKTFKGVASGVARSAKGDLAVTVDRGEAGHQDFAVKLFDRDLKAGWEVGLPSVKSTFREVPVTAMATGGYVVVGGKDDKPYVARITDGGKIASEFWGNNLNGSPNYYLIATNGTAYVVWSFFEEFTNAAGKIEATEKVRVIKFREK